MTEELTGGAPGNRATTARKWAALVATVLALSAGAGDAGAGPFANGAVPCDGQAPTRPFLPWLDPAQYVFAPNGGFEKRGSWTLAGGAQTVSGNEPFQVHGPSDTRALALPAGSAATSRAMCVGLEHPTLRLFARGGGSLLATLRVEVLFEDVSGALRALEVARITGAAGWQPTLPIAFLANVPGSVLAGVDGTTAVAFRFTALGGDWRIDDVYVDPFKSR